LSIEFTNCKNDPCVYDPRGPKGPKETRKRGEIEIVDDAMELSFQKYSTLIVWETLVIASDPLCFLRALRDSLGP
jgi:hypothetical protein